MFSIPVMSHGKNLETIEMDPRFVRSGSCWVTSNDMTESAARALAGELSS